jgi:hypothetical protein
VAIDNAGLYEHQQKMIVRLQQLQEHLSQAERDQLVALERGANYRRQRSTGRSERMNHD